MKKTNLIILLSAFFMFSSGDVVAQKWLKKVSKAIDNAGREIDKQVKKLDEALAVEEEQAPENAPADKIQDYRGAKVKTFNSQVGISIESCIRDNNVVRITYFMKNTGPQLSLVNIGTGRTIINPDDETNIYDNLGNSYYIEHQSLGKNKTTRPKQFLSALLIQNVPMKGIIEVKSVDPKATSFSLVNIAGIIQISQSKLDPFSYSFMDLPIYEVVPEVVVSALPVKEENVVSAPSTKEVENTAVQRQSDNAKTATATTATKTAATTKLTIPKTKAVMSLKDSYTAYDNRKRITQAERVALKINQIKYERMNFSGWPNSKIAKGKVIYSGDKGTLQTILLIERGDSATELLLSYNANGDLIDCIGVGDIRAYGGDRGQTYIQGDEVLACISAEGSEFYKKYKITPQLKFTLIKEWTVD